VLPAAHEYPAVQLPEHAAVVKPATAPKVPAGHGAVHAADAKPVEAPYRPAEQLVHAPAPAREYFPALHAAWVAATEPATQ
jgi:hypothetical protein